MKLSLSLSLSLPFSTHYTTSSPISFVSKAFMLILKRRQFEIKTRKNEKRKRIVFGSKFGAQNFSTFFFFWRQKKSISFIGESLVRRNFLIWLKAKANKTPHPHPHLPLLVQQLQLQQRQRQRVSMPRLFLFLVALLVDKSLLLSCQLGGFIILLLCVNCCWSRLLWFDW